MMVIIQSRSTLKVNVGWWSYMSMPFLVLPVVEIGPIITSQLPIRLKCVTLNTNYMMHTHLDVTMVMCKDLLKLSNCVLQMKCVKCKLHARCLWKSYFLKVLYHSMISIGLIRSKCYYLLSWLENVSWRSWRDLKKVESKLKFCPNAKVYIHAYRQKLAV